MAWAVSAMVRVAALVAVAMVVVATTVVAREVLGWQVKMEVRMRGKLSGDWTGWCLGG